MDEFEYDELYFDEEDNETLTSVEQCKCEEQCARYLLPFTRYTESKLDKLKRDEIVNEENEICLMRDLHAAYLEKGMLGLSGSFVSLDASRPWLCYWILHALYLLKREPENMYSKVLSFLTCCQNTATTGGFGGGPSQLSHCAPTYAAVLALCTIGSDEALLSINRPKLYAFFWSLKNDITGAFCMHRDGETDTRSIYTVLAVARLLNILTPELAAGCAEFLASCQSYEGGFGGEPGNEAHGGYNFCALAGLLILGQAHSIDLDAQEYWIQRRQVRLEGGFQGRTNKTVDSCYSFWQGAAAALVNIIRREGSDVADLDIYLQQQRSQMGENHGAAAVRGQGQSQPHASGDFRADIELDLDAEDGDGAGVGSIKISRISDQNGSLPVNQKALQRYILHCGQQIEQDKAGGLRDKPGKSRDYYHSCYALSGLSIAQSFPVTPIAGGQQKKRAKGRGFPMVPAPAGPRAPAHVYGDLGNLLEPTSAVFNIGLPKLHRALAFYAALPAPCHEDLLRTAV